MVIIALGYPFKVNPFYKQGNLFKKCLVVRITHCERQEDVATQLKVEFDPGSEKEMLDKVIQFEVFVSSKVSLSISNLDGGGLNFFCCYSNLSKEIPSFSINEKYICILLLLLLLLSLLLLFDEVP